jgi:hypothetical protein
VFDPGLGCIRAGFFFSRYGFNFHAPENDPSEGADLLKTAQKQTARENPRRIGGTYSLRARQVKVKEPGNRPK